MIYLVKIIPTFVLIAIVAVKARIHKLPLTDDDRHYVDLTTFGFFQGGVLDVRMINFKLPANVERGEYGFTLDRTVNDAISPYLEAHSDTCFLKDSESSVTSPQHPAIVFLKMDFVNMKLNITCKGNDLTAMHLYQNRSQIPLDRTKRSSLFLKHPYITKRSADNELKGPECVPPCSCAHLPITKETKNGFDYFNTSFAMYVASVREEGLYNLYFHNCPRTDKGVTPAMNFVIEIYESNDGNFLSAGEMPLPALYSTMSLIFLLSAGFWTFILKTSKHPVYRIHILMCVLAYLKALSLAFHGINYYFIRTRGEHVTAWAILYYITHFKHPVYGIHILMCVLAYLKALSLAFHGINYYFIRTRGEHVTAWAILYYITHLLKGAVLFVTIVLVGTGWNFIKHILADRDKKLFMIVIPLQVVANVAEIIIAESEEGAAEHTAWSDTFILVDLLCCGAILFPVVWSIRHLQDASSTDGKAAINLRKLKLFRHFYIMVVCYIYFTRFIVYLLKITVPFQYSWIDEMSRELATFVFFVMTGYKFRPAAANPYFTPNTLDDDALVLSEIGVLEGVTKIPHRGERKRDDTMPLMQDGYNSD